MLHPFARSLRLQIDYFSKEKTLNEKKKFAQQALRLSFENLLS